MIYVKVKFMENYTGKVRTKGGMERPVTFREGEVYEVEPLDEKGRTADLKFMAVPEGSEVKVGEVGLDVFTAILAVNMGSYWEHKKAKVEQAEAN